MVDSEVGCFASFYHNHLVTTSVCISMSFTILCLKVERNKVCEKSRSLETYRTNT